MTRYNYRNAVLEDIRTALENDYDLTDFTDEEDAYEALYDALWIDDSVTGNGSGSYWCNTWKAEECLNHNWDEIEDTALTFGCDAVIDSAHNAEYWDVSIRCRYLDECLNQVLEEYYNPNGIVA